MNGDVVVTEWIRKGSGPPPGMPPDDEIEYIRKMLDRGEFTEIHEMVKFWRAIKTLGVFAGAVRRVAIGAALFLAALATVSESAREGLKRWLGL